MDIRKFRIPTLNGLNFGSWLDHIQLTMRILDIWDAMRGDILTTNPITRDLLSKPSQPGQQATAAEITAYITAKAIWSKKVWFIWTKDEGQKGEGQRKGTSKCQCIICTRIGWLVYTNGTINQFFLLRDKWESGMVLGQWMYWPYHAKQEQFHPVLGTRTSHKGWNNWWEIPQNRGLWNSYWIQHNAEQNGFIADPKHAIRSRGK